MKLIVWLIILWRVSSWIMWISIYDVSTYVSCICWILVIYWSTCCFDCVHDFGENKKIHVVRCSWYVSMIMLVDWLLEMKQILCRVGKKWSSERNFWKYNLDQLIGPGFLSRPIDWWKPLILKKMRIYVTNRLAQLPNRLYGLPDFEKSESFSYQSIDTQHQSIGPLLSLKMELWVTPIDWASLTNRLAHAFYLMSYFLMFLYALYQLIITCYNSYELNQ